MDRTVSPHHVHADDFLLHEALLDTGLHPLLFQRQREKEGKQLLMAVVSRDAPVCSRQAVCLK